MHAMQQTSTVILLKYISAYYITSYIRGVQNSLERMRGEPETSNFLADLLIFLVLLVQFNRGVHGPIQEVVSEVSEASGASEASGTSEASEAEGAAEVSEVSEGSGAEEGSEAEEAAVNTIKEPQAKVEVASEPVPVPVNANEAVPEPVKNQANPVSVADKHDKCCVIN